MPSCITGAAAARPSADAKGATLILDTNTVLDWLVFADPAASAVGAAITRGRFEWLATPRTMAELRAVLARPLAARWERARELALTIDPMALATVCPEPAIDPRLACRDAADQVFVDLALEHRPSVLLTRDRALLALRRRAADRGVRIETARAWLAARADLTAFGARQPRSRAG